PASNEPLRFGRVIVVGGGCYGSYYVRQAQRAARTGVLCCDGVQVIDRDSECAVARVQSSGTHEPWRMPVEVIRAEWSDYFRAYLDAASDQPVGVRQDAIVPSPLMPHLVGDWLVGRIERTHPERRVRVVPIDRAPSIPWLRTAPDHTLYVSFAEWMCPINCIEPAICPELGTPRAWSLVRRVRDYAVAEEARTGRPTRALLAHCRHRTYGVGMFDTSEILASESEAEAAMAVGGVDLLIGTVSHCHGALRRIAVD
ncbi:MAG TPA: hypothetical protein VMH39_14705, partial [Gemmatimonadaceae bacterium]|nr:hypothetical protein [Gemmatimonadaceae bacterium]